MFRLFLHVGGGDDERTASIELTEMPRVGEYVALAPDDQNWHRVVTVIHVAFEAHFDAEVFTTPVNYREVIGGARGQGQASQSS